MKPPEQPHGNRHKSIYNRVVKIAGCLGLLLFSGCSPSAELQTPMPNNNLIVNESWLIYAPVVVLVIFFSLILVLLLSFLALVVTVWLGWSRGWRPSDGFKALITLVYQPERKSDTKPHPAQSLQKTQSSLVSKPMSRAEISERVAALKRAWRTRRLSLEDHQRAQKKIVMHQAIANGVETQNWLDSQPAELETHSLNPIVQRVFSSPAHPSLSQINLAILEAKQELQEIQRQLRDIQQQLRNGQR